MTFSNLPSNNLLSAEYTTCINNIILFASDLVIFFIFQLIGAAFGAAGQRCMALTTAIFVGESKEWIPDLVAKAKELKVNEGTVS